MRVRFGQRSAAEEQALAELDRKIDGVYRDALERERSSTWWSRTVPEVLPGLEAERGSDARVVVRPSEREFTPLAERFAEAAPESLVVLSRRPAYALAQALKRAKLRGFDFARARARAGFGRGHLLDVVLQQPGGSGAREELEAARGLVWEVLGERVADDWVRGVDVTPAPRGGALRVVSERPEPSGFPLADLVSAVEAAVNGVHAGLTPEPLWAEAATAEWTLLELSPEPADDYAADDDLVLASTCRPELLKCHLEQAPFSSARFTRHGELFFMLKYEDASADEARLEKRRKLEDHLDQVLSRERIGRVIAAGLGVRYTYLYLGLAEADSALLRVSELARAERLSEQSWLLPLDTDLAEEWVGVWPGGKPPP